MRFALVTPRYGAEITRGAEHACRLLAEELADRHDIDVLTTFARDSFQARGGHAEGADRVRGVLVRRFAPASGHDPQAFEALSRRLYAKPHTRADEAEWLRRSGTSSPGLLDFLKRHHRNYDALMFFSYAAGTTVQGIRVAPERSILFPGASVHPALRLWICQETLTGAAAIGYGSATERRVVRAYAPHHPRVEEIVGIGVGAVHESRYPRLHEPAPETEEAEPADEELLPQAPPSYLAGRGVLFRRRNRLHGRYCLYAGPIVSDNGTEELIEYFSSYAEADGEAALLLMGVKMMKLPDEPWLRSPGVLSEFERLAALEAADVVVAPEPHDYLCEHTLDAMAAGTPVLASARNAAAVGHVRRSNAGLYYANREEFIEAMGVLMSDASLRLALGKNARRYVQQHYRWDAVIGRFERLVSKVKGR